VWWLVHYTTATPSVAVRDNTTVRLDYENEPQPDAFLCLEPEHGGTSRLSEDDYTEGPPDLVVEVAASSAAFDLHDKFRAYQRNGVREYVVLQVYERRVAWFVLREGVYGLLEPDEAGIIRSELFPGLWLKPEALWTEDLAGLLAVLQQGLASPEHTEFVARLQAAGG
jgi:Uma2 family endonuclease